jgi:hypothetical protein
VLVCCSGGTFPPEAVRGGLVGGTGSPYLTVGAVLSSHELGVDLPLISRTVMHNLLYVHWALKCNVLETTGPIDALKPDTDK